MAQMWRFFCTEQIPDNVLARMNYVDVRDTTEAIVRALEKEETAGKATDCFERYVCPAVSSSHGSA